MSRWAVCLPPDAAPRAANLRLEPGIEVLEQPAALWLRGESADERLERLLRSLPGARRYAVLGDGQLRAAGARLPQGRLPGGNWQKIKAWADVELPVAALGACCPEPAPLRMVRSAAGREANVLVTHLAVWAKYGDGAPQVRLERLRFAVAADGRAVIHGSPLPPLEGERFYERAGVALPCGWVFSPDIGPELVQKAWAVGPQDLALVRPDATWEHIRGNQFVRATRSAIRQSADPGSAVTRSLPD